MYIFASIVASVTALIAAGVLYQRIGARRDRLSAGQRRRRERA